MRKILFGSVLTLVMVFMLRYCEHERDQRAEVQQSSALIQKQLNNVGKLIVTEGNFAQVYTYEDLKTLYFDLFSAKKKPLNVTRVNHFVNAVPWISQPI